MPTRIFENLALGKPVIVPDTKGIRDYFDDAQIIYFQPGDATNLASRIKWVYDNPDDANAIVARA